jgi:hypothetical protein
MTCNAIQLCGCAATGPGKRQLEIERKREEQIMEDMFWGNHFVGLFVSIEGSK